MIKREVNLNLSIGSVIIEEMNYYDKMHLEIYGTKYDNLSQVFLIKPLLLPERRVISKSEVIKLTAKDRIDIIIASKALNIPLKSKEEKEGDNVAKIPFYQAIISLAKYYSCTSLDIAKTFSKSQISEALKEVNDYEKMVKELIRKEKAGDENLKAAREEIKTLEKDKTFQDMKNKFPIGSPAPCLKGRLN